KIRRIQPERNGSKSSCCWWYRSIVCARAHPLTPVFHKTKASRRAKSNLGKSTPKARLDHAILARASFLFAELLHRLFHLALLFLRGLLVVAARLKFFEETFLDELTLQDFHRFVEIGFDRNGQRL